MKNQRIMTIKGHPIVVWQVNDADYISLSDLAGAGAREGEDTSAAIATWIKAGDTMKFLAVWEKLYGAGERFSDEAYWQHTTDSSIRKSFSMSPARWIESTGAVGISVKRGRGGSVYAHEDIALQFCTWLDPVYYLYVLKEFKRLKEEEQRRLDPEWSVRRVLAAASWRIQTDAVRDYEIPRRGLPQDLDGFVYADEAETLNLALFHITSKQWRADNPALTTGNKNLRDYATTKELIVLSNIEGINALLMEEGYSRPARIKYLADVVEQQLLSLSKVDIGRGMMALEKKAKQLQASKQTNSFDAGLKGLLSIPPPPKQTKRPKPGDQEPIQSSEPWDGAFLFLGFWAGGLS